MFRNLLLPNDPSLTGLNFWNPGVNPWGGTTSHWGMGVVQC